MPHRRPTFARPTRFPRLGLALLLGAAGMTLTIALATATTFEVGGAGNLDVSPAGTTDLNLGASQLTLNGGTLRTTASTGEIVATLPAGPSATAPGSYRLMVSFGNGTAATDVFEFTIGAVGLRGEKDETGVQGAKGDKGDPGAQGVQGATGVTGLQNLPIYQNKPAAIAAGVAVGQYWVHEGSGQVLRMMDQN